MNNNNLVSLRHAILRRIDFAEEEMERERRDKSLGAMAGRGIMQGYILAMSHTLELIS